MIFISDKALERLRETSDIPDPGDTPDLGGTRYRLGERIGSGGMGAVYAAMDEVLGRRVALKVLDAPDPSGGLANRLNREARVLARLEHPGIVPVHDFGVLADGRVYYTMKFVEGQRLDKHIENLASLPDRLRLFLRICDTVAFAHARGVLHRDLKPGNIMVGSFGEVLVMDWGLAKIFRDHADCDGGTIDVAGTIIDAPNASRTEAEQPKATVVTGHGTVMGTPGYMSPEQAGGDIAHLDERSDIFALGAVLRLICDGVASAAPPQGRTGTSKALESICAKATAANPTERYSSVTALSDDVSRYLDGLPVTARKEAFLEKAGRFYRRHSVAILLITAYLVMRVLLVLFDRR